MKYLTRCLIVTLIGLSFSCQNPKPTSDYVSPMLGRTDIAAPDAGEKPETLSLHGDTRVDPYYWLNQRSDSNVIHYLEAENAYREKMTAHLKAFEEKLYQEMRGRIKEDDESVPYKDNGYYYLTRYETGQEYATNSRKKGSLQAAEEVLLDVNEMAKPYGYYDVGDLAVSPDNKILAYTEDTLSRRIYNIRFKNLETGAMLQDNIPGTSGSVVWANDNRTVFYTIKDETLRNYKVLRHKLGTNSTQDLEVYHEKDATFDLYLGKSKSNKFIYVVAGQTLSTEYLVLDANQPEGKFKPVHPRERNLEYHVSDFGDKFYIRTNLNAPNFRLMETPQAASGKANWKEVIPHREEVLLEGMDVFKNYLVLSERKAGIAQIRIKPWNGSAEHYIPFQEEAYVAYTGINLDYDTELLRLEYESMTTPPTTYDYNMASQEFTQLKQQEVLGGFNPADYISERAFVTARDGAKVPVSIVYKKGFVKDGSQPLMLYAYGSYGSTMEPYFSLSRLSLLDRGFVYAIAHIRGGQEMGRQWYENGKLLKKKNTFTDFIDCAEFLIEEKYCAKDKVFAMGGSAGGLLMGAVTNMRPDLWKGVIAEVPFVDVVTTMLDASIPLTTFEWDEWGNPAQKEYYDYMKSYSPYDQVEAKDYPALFITTGLHDSQVQYWEPAKWVAKMRKMKTDDNPLLLHTNMEAGHGGASGRFESLKELAMEYAFVLDLVGKAEVEVKN